MRPTLIFLFLSLLSKTLAGPLDFWTCTLVLTNASVSDAIFANGRFVVSLGAPWSAGSRSSTMISEDGITWRETREQTITRLATGNGVIVGVAGDVGAAGDSIVSSSDGVAWIARRPFLIGTGINAISFGLGRFLAQVSAPGPDPNRAWEMTSDLWSSVDGINWIPWATNIWPPFQGGNSPRVTFVQDRWTTLGWPLGPDFPIGPLESFDGIQFMPNTTWPPMSALVHNGNTWVGTLWNNSSQIAVSKDATNWSVFSPNPNWSNGRLTTYGGRFFCARGANYFFESIDGTRWVDHEVDLARSAKWFGVLGIFAPILAGNNRAVAFAGVLTPPTNSIGNGSRPVTRFYVSQPLTNSIVPELGMMSLPALRLEAGTVGSGYHVEASEAVGGAWRRVATVFPTNFPFTFLAPEGEQRGRFYRAVVRD